jgi:hypothetical protein
MYPVLAAAVLCGAAITASADVQLTAAPVSAPAGGVVAVPISFTGLDDAPTIVVLQIDFLSADFTPLGGVLDGPGVPAEITFDWNAVGNTLYAIVYSLNSPISASHSLELYVRADTGVAPDTYSFANVGGSATNADGEDLAIDFAGLSIEVTQQSGQHSADITQDWGISLSELLRVIQFYNSPGLHCEAGTEDGYAPGPGSSACDAHDSDYIPTDWDINLSELLRLIQFYNFVGGSYHPDPLGEDGFGAGPF